MTPELGQKSIKILICLVIIVATVIAYEPIRHNGFVNYDDDQYITENPEIKAGLTWESLGRAFTKPHFFMWHPLTTISHLTDYELFGLNPLGHHLVNVFIHIINAIVLFWLLIILTGSTSSPQAGSKWASAFVAAVFALHPLQVESVAWASERKTVLSGFFWFLTIAVYMWYARRPGIGRYILLFGIYALCIMTKPIVVTLPLVLLLLDYWPLGRFDGLKQGKRLLAEKAPLLGLSAVLSVMTFITQQQGGAVASLSKMPFDFRLANTSISYIRYIGKLIWPSNLAMFYPLPYSNFPIDTAVICGILFVLMTGLSIWTGLRRKYVLVGWLWYVGTLVPVCGLVQSGDQAIADRYMYIPMLGLLIILVCTIKEFFTKGLYTRVFTTVLALAVLFSATVTTREQVRYWQDSKTLFGHALKVTENNIIAENDYGWILFEEGKFGEAEVYFRNALRILPVYFEAQYNLGRVYLKQGNLNEAIACFNKLLQRKESVSLHYDLAAALARQKKYDEAINHLVRALEMEPANTEARKKMGALLNAQGKPDEAIRQLKQALETSPQDDEIYANLGMAYRRKGDNELAIENLTKAVRLKPNNTVALTSLAWVLATKDEVTAEDANSAIKYALRACELTSYKEAAPLDTLAAADAAGGRFDEAVKTSKQAIETARAKGQESVIGEMQERLKLYEAGQRYRKQQKTEDR